MSHRILSGTKNTSLTHKIVNLKEYRGWKDRTERAGGQMAFEITGIDIQHEKEESDEQGGEDV